MPLLIGVMLYNYSIISKAVLWHVYNSVPHKISNVLKESTFVSKPPHFEVPVSTVKGKVAL